MAAAAIADTGFLIALLRERDAHGGWARAVAREFKTPWHTCEAVLAEAFHILPKIARPAIAGLLERQAVLVSFSFPGNQDHVLKLMQKYSDLPIDLADACIVRMTEILTDPVVLTTDSHFRTYRRNSRQVVPCAMPE